MTYLFLYTELADYFISCCKALSVQNEVHIIRWPVNKEAPFQFDFGQALKVYNKSDYDFAGLTQLIQKIKPDVIICSGWIDKDYLKQVKPYFKKIPTVITLDTKWRGTVKQLTATLLSRAYLTNRFSHIWVPGKQQARYASKLGFKKNNILLDFYCCDLKKFNAAYLQQFEKKKTNFPQKFIYVGRYYDFKGIEELWEAFVQLSDEQNHEWELWCVGTGSVKPRIHPKIKHFGFIQPDDLISIMEQTGVFILPSRFEPWAVVVQEFAAAGFPLLLSQEVGASEAFLESGKNGYSFRKENVNELKNNLKKVLSLEQQELVKMGEYSHLLAQKINPENWINTLKKITNEFNRK
ncbi:MAG: glycosyltransferase [Sphingobacteriaceae bacterium]|nr:glycosyltransferase [Sphingobacteriaceae bacterium]